MSTPAGEARDVAREVLVREEARRVLRQLAVELLVQALRTRVRTSHADVMWVFSGTLVP